MAFEFDKETKVIAVNRGDRGAIRLINNKGNFLPGDKIKFSIVDKKNYGNLVFQKTFTIGEESPEFCLTLTKLDTKIGDIISSAVTYWYEIEYNGDNTLVGYDRKTKAKKFILLPEAPDKEGGDE